MTSPSSVIRPPARLLLGPGPSPLHPRIYAALSQPIVGHLDPYLFEVFDHIRGGLQLCWGTRNEFTHVIPGTGHAGMEAAVINFVAPGARFAVFVNGMFGERLCEMGRRRGAQLLRFDKPWGEVFSDQEAADFITRERPDVAAFVHAETSTGALQDGRAIAQAARKIGALTIADCVASLGGMPLELDAMGVDVAYSGTQKALGAPPGLAPITCSPRAVERLRARPAPVPYYLDLRLLADYYEPSRRYHHTPPVPLFYALREALAIIEEEGLDNRFARHQANHEACAAGLEKLGLRLFVAQPHRLWTVIAPRVPAGVDDALLRRSLFQNHGIDIAGGIGILAGQILRIGTMGYGSSADNIKLLLAALEEALHEQGYRA
ncbi:MAG: pyridoxal-phosphate-dependent aminotransferase family protein [Bryobacteraceae bacterium]